MISTLVSLVAVLGSAPAFALKVDSSCSVDGVLLVRLAGARAKLEVQASTATRMGDVVMVSDLVVTEKGEAEVRIPFGPQKVPPGAVGLRRVSVSVDGVWLTPILLDTNGKAGACIEVLRIR